MDCAEFRESLFEPRGPQTRLAQFVHARGCGACRAEAQDGKQIGQAIRALPVHAAPDGLRERLTRVVAEEGTAPARRRFAWSQVLVVAATLLILSAMLYPVLNLIHQKWASEAEDAASTTRCLVNLKNLGLALLIYAQDYDDHLPEAEDWPSVLVPYLLGQSKESPVFWCSEDTDPTHWPSYAMVPRLSRADLKSVQDRGKHALLYDAEADGSFARRHVAPTGVRGGNAVYVDGHAMFSRDAPLGVPGHVPEP
jgi:prepilin-type processing-associated H-X9-DG protein